mgnify:CR=1 FL=1
MKSIFIHQPEYFPWTHFFEKLFIAEIVVILDSVQYSRRSYQNRNLIYSKNGPKWITLPVHKSSRNTKIIDIKINNEIDWQKKHYESIYNSYFKAKFFFEINDLFKNIFNRKWDYLCELNIYIIREILKYLKLNNNIYLSSELNLSSKKSDLILEICNLFNANEYITGMGSKNYLDHKNFEDNNIKIIYTEPKNHMYNQGVESNFMPNLSILDYLYNNGSTTEFLK